jgi:TolB-like protein/Tfp pilus assembly protein PilF
MSGRRGLWQRMRERGVVRVAASYAVIAWLLLQIADVTFEPLGLPRWAMVALIVAAVVGFPVAVLLAWVYEVGDRGIQRDDAHEGAARPTVHGVRRYADVAVIAVLVLAVAVLLVRQSHLAGPDRDARTVAVLPFENLSRADDGEVLALGIAEAVLHQLANLAELEVISRTSSFAFRERNQDAREIGRQLGARYLLEGSVQSDRTRMRVTTQLIDASTGSDVWSMRFDRPPGDVFAVQDEIAVQVARALELSLDASSTDRLTGQGTQNLDAYLAYLQGRSLLANDRVVDMREAIDRFERAVRLDPKFAAPYVNLAEAGLFVAEYEVADDRPQRFERALARGRELVDRALGIDPHYGDAYLQRAHLTAFDDLQAAEADYRRGLELSPNSARGYAGLAAVLYEDPARRDEALELLDKARRLDPLELGYDVTRAVFMHYERGDTRAAGALLAGVLERNPTYLPALVRRCELNTHATGNVAEAALDCERALAVDPLSEEARRLLTKIYLDLGEDAAAVDVAGDPSDRADVPQVEIAMARKEWRRAGELAYAVLERGAESPNTRGMVLAAIRMHAKLTNETERAIAAIESVGAVSWTADGEPVLQDWSPLRDAEIELGAVLLDGPQPERGRVLLAMVVERMEHDLRVEHRPDFWYLRWHPVALALLGRRDAALTMLERAADLELMTTQRWWYLDAEPAFDPLRRDPRFAALRQRVARHVERQQHELDRLRREGLIPDRSGGR